MSETLRDERDEGSSRIDASRDVAATRRPRRTWFAVVATVGLVLAVLVALTAKESPSVDVEFVFAAPHDDGSIHVGDGYRLRIRPRTSARVYAALFYESDGAHSVLLPTDVHVGDPEVLPAGMERTVPEAPATFVLADHPGGFALVTVACTEALPAGDWAAFLDRLTPKNLLSLPGEFVSDHRGTSVSLSRGTMQR
ncbi:MAG: hypothetical protein HYR85_19400 [Planctomycetes bacterium]|nr:hypothetical protein [Planctomycetota bacterium]MBI3848089.1 hypothetical protein [Planctomycetota bacterium]